ERAVGVRGEQRRRGEQPYHLAEGEGHDGQVVAAQPQRREADDEAERRRQQAAQHQRDDEAHAQGLGRGQEAEAQGLHPALDGEAQREVGERVARRELQVLARCLGEHKQARDVAADQHEAVVAQRKDARDAVYQVQADGRDAPDREQGEDLAQLHAAVRAHEVEHDQQRRRRGGVQQAAEGHAAPARGEGVLRHTFSERSSPTIPDGLSRRIRIIAANANVSLYSVMPVNEPTRGNSAVRKFSRKPRSTPPITAPGRLPMPPITAAANALMPGSTPKTAGWLMLPKLMPHITAEAAASIEPSRNVEEMTLSTSTPIIRAVSAS